jgi:hypothetical protein
VLGSDTHVDTYFTVAAGVSCLQRSAPLLAVWDSGAVLTAVREYAAVTSELEKRNADVSVWGTHSIALRCS